jgi:hypothetical protein
MSVSRRVKAYAVIFAAVSLPLAARAQSLPVVNVNNEIGLAADVMLQNQQDRYLPANGPSPELSGWAETVGGNLNTPANYNFGYGDGPLWQAGIGLDYLVYRNIHLYGGVDYTNATLERGPVEFAGFPDSRVPQANFNDLTFHLGLAWGF